MAPSGDAQEAPTYDIPEVAVSTASAIVYAMPVEDGASGPLDVLRKANPMYEPADAVNTGGAGAGGDGFVPLDAEMYAQYDSGEDDAETYEPV